ncbi:MAG: hypothetical protein GY832_07700 [Chloroflexi bacterium]|nr:hypothetical protein [Chloroflexota bacterium]
MMEIKGVSVKAAPEFVRQRFGSRYDEWFNSLSESSRDVVKNAFASNWYPLYEAVIEPTKKVCDIFFGGSEQGAWEVGRTSADQALKGVYKIFVKVGSPGFIISRASRIFGNMLKPGEMTVIESSPNKAVMHMQLPESDRLLELRMAGWMQQALVISGCKDPKFAVTQSIAKGDPITEFVATWK